MINKITKFVSRFYPFIIYLYLQNQLHYIEQNLLMKYFS